MSKLNLKKKRNFGGLFYYARHNKKRRYLSMKGKLKLVRRLLLFKKFKNFSRSLEGKSYNFLKRDSQQKRNFKLVGKFLFVPTLLKDYRGYNVESRYRLKRFLSVYGSHWYRHKKFWKRLLYVNYKLKRKMIPKISFRRRSNFKRLSNLFFFWFLLLYQDLYKFLMKIIWSLWFKFIYISKIFNNYNKLFYSIKKFYLGIPNNFYILFINSINFFSNDNNLNLFFSLQTQRILGSFFYFLLSGTSIYNAEYISASFNQDTYLYLFKLRWSKWNMKLGRYYRLKF